VTALEDFSSYKPVFKLRKLSDISKESTALFI